MLKSERFGWVLLKWIRVEQNGAVIRFDPREVVDLSRWEEHKPFGIAQTSIQTLFDGGLPNRVFIGPSETWAVEP